MLISLVVIVLKTWQQHPNLRCIQHKSGAGWRSFRGKGIFFPLSPSRYLACTKPNSLCVATTDPTPSRAHSTLCPENPSLPPEPLLQPSPTPSARGYEPAKIGVNPSCLANWGTGSGNAQTSAHHVPAHPAPESTSTLGSWCRGPALVQHQVWIGLLVWIHADLLSFLLYKVVQSLFFPCLKMEFTFTLNRKPW